jgi:hypothetical protein
MNGPTSTSKRFRKRRGGTLLDRLVHYEKDSTFLPPFSFGGWIFFLVGLVSALFVGWIIYPMVLYSEKPQPMNFNHARHLSEDIGIEGDSEVEKCLYCHGFRDDGTFVGIPKLESCMDCHDDPDSPMGDTEAEEFFLKNYVADGKEIPWLPYYRQPNNVYFSHIAHVKNADMECEICHGNHGKTEKLPPYKVNLMTGYSINIWGRNIAGYRINTWDRMKMDDCAECHAENAPPQNNACFVCHK